MRVAEPIVEKLQDNISSLKEFEEEISNSNDDKLKDAILNFPIVYIHNWKNNNDYEVYVGESNNIFQRTKQHYSRMTEENEWQHNLSDGKANLYIIGHEHFNKSMTLDIENKLIHYLMSVESIKKVHNGRSNPQNRYYPIEELNNIFTKIWRKLRKENKEIFPLETTIKDSAIFKASPLHKLTEEQQKAKELIIEKVIKALRNNERGQLIFIEGEAGTGKTVLNSSTFYELFCRYEEAKNNNEDLKTETSNCFLLVNHDEQITVYKQIADKLGLTDKYGQVVYKPTSFINKYSVDNPVDVVFVDEAHLLLTQGKQSYRGNNQLEDILKRAKVVVVMFDEDQILTTEQYWEDELLEKYKSEAINNGNYIKLENQLRMHANEDVIEWINSFTKEGIIRQLPNNLGDYDIKIFDTPEELEKEIVKKSLKDETKLSRLIATYDWPYNSNKKSKKDFKYWEVKIGKWHKPWNRELEQDFDRKQKRKIKNLSWAEQPQTIEEVGSTFTIQGFDLNYAGVILGPSVKYRNGHIVFDTKESCNEKATRNRTLSDGTSKKFGEKFLKHEVRVLMTRGVNGLYIYACDDELREHLKQCSFQDIQYEINEHEDEIGLLKVAEDSEEYRYD
ncbi:DUF2075 domain-containing protein [uncultured Subdoligranulum sp.]|uniref:DUF2075 domain-containing protein n=1 Tax=uncultured Subdoligranulum sp. TaxID=512298 RepID=UPI0025E8941A|nr:DNA/RNA helicase domain-containing protein [uncultured Subdoligranulum sp.]